nr:MAG: hypothetical protein J07AB56_08450 [Candidatus Nanosalinarum sp. J07AB56]
MGALSQESNLPEPYSNINRSIESDNIDRILKGASVLAGGGGGTYRGSLDNYRLYDPRKVDIVDLGSLPSDSNVVTVFGVGPADHGTQNPTQVALESVEVYESRYAEVDAIIPGELGPSLIVEAAVVADELGVPVVDADVAGMRAVPSIRNEILEVSDISRAPVITTNGQQLSVLEEADGQQMEQHIRRLTDGDLWYVAGYADTPASYMDAVPQGWFDECMRFDSCQLKRIGDGLVESVDTRQSRGHTVGRLLLQGEREIEVFFQNENLLLFVDGQRVASAPDTISLVNDTGVGITSADPPETGEHLEAYVVRHEFWDNPDCFDLETQNISVTDGAVKFPHGVQIDIRGRPSR